MTLQEEMKVVDHVKWRASIGHGLDWHMLGLLLQELFLALKLANPARVTGLEDVGQLPTSIWIRRFAERHNLVGRATMPISKGRLSPLRRSSCGRRMPSPSSPPSQSSNQINVDTMK